jgi:polar amino acid transport system permease protein
VDTVGDAGDLDVRPVPVRHVGRWVSVAVILGLVAWLVAAAAGSGAVEGAVVRRYLFNRSILEGVRNTLVIAVWPRWRASPWAWCSR